MREENQVASGRLRSHHPECPQRGAAQAVSAYQLSVVRIEGPFQLGTIGDGGSRQQISGVDHTKPSPVAVSRG